jgi:hypothetical protein
VHTHTFSLSHTQAQRLTEGAEGALRAERQKLHNSNCWRPLPYHTPFPPLLSIEADAGVFFFCHTGDPFPPLHHASCMSCMYRHYMLYHIT